MDVQMEDVLPARGTGVLPHREAVRTDPFPDPPGHGGTGPSEGGGDVGIGRPEVPHVPSGDHEGVSAGGGLGVEERDAVLVGMHHVRRDVSGDQAAEQAGGVVVHASTLVGVGAVDSEGGVDVEIGLDPEVELPQVEHVGHEQLDRADPGQQRELGS